MELIKLYPDAIGTSHEPSSRYYLPLENPDAIVKLLGYERPEVVVNCAALTNVDRCEKEKEYAYKVNGIAVRSMAIECGKIGAKLVQISTDHVFDGDVGNYSEYTPVTAYFEMCTFGFSTILTILPSIISATPNCSGFCTSVTAM